MSYWVYLQDENGSVEVERHAEGGTHALGGTSEAEINITYNYSKHIRQALHADGLMWLDGQAAHETISALEKAVEQLGTERYTGAWYVLRFGGPGGLRPSDPRLEPYRNIELNDPANADLLRQARAQGFVYDTGGYWADTPGNAGYALSILLAWARQHPGATWKVS